MAYRISFSIILLLSVLFMPYGVSAILGVFGMFYFKFFTEALLMFLVSDLTYATPELRYYGGLYTFFIIGLGLFVVIEIFKNNSRLYRR